MSGYGGADDHVEAQQNHNDDSLRLQQIRRDRQDNRTGMCLECGSEIPRSRRMALPGCRYCLECQRDLEKAKKAYAQNIVRKE
jgi:phage/conjugal plasmid C-4 type zinc finger TraR family protein